MSGSDLVVLDPALPDAGRIRLLDRVRLAVRMRHYSRRTEDAYVMWIRRYIVFHGKRHPSELGAAQVAAFLSSLATKWRVSASTQNQALSALIFLYRVVLAMDLGNLPAVVRARVPERLPTVLDRDEVRRVLMQMHGTAQLIAGLLYGAGLRLQECLELRVKDLDFARGQIVVRRGKGQKDRATVLPVILRERLAAHLAGVKSQHESDLEAGLGRIVLPFALDRKFPQAATDWRWQFVFPAARICTDPRWGPPTRYHLHESAVQRAVTEAARKAGITKRVTCHTFRHHADSAIMRSRAAPTVVSRRVLRRATCRIGIIQMSCSCRPPGRGRRRHAGSLHQRLRHAQAVAHGAYRDSGRFVHGSPRRARLRASNHPGAAVAPQRLEPLDGASAAERR